MCVSSCNERDALQVDFHRTSSAFFLYTNFLREVETFQRSCYAENHGKMHYYT